MSEPTPGPWEARGGNVIGPCGVGVAFCGPAYVAGVDGSYGISEKEAHANARLVAAARDLLQMLAKLRDRMAYDGIPNDSLPLWQEANALIHLVNGQELAK